MVVESGEDHGPELSEESVVLVGVEEFMELDVNACEASSDARCFPLDEGVEDGLALGVIELEKAGSGMLGDEVECLQHSESHVLLGQVWELLFEFTEGLSIGLGLGIKLVVVPIFAGSVLPDSIGEGLKLVSIRCEVTALVGDTHQGGTLPTAKVVVPEMLEGRFMVDLGFVGNGWDPNVRREVGVVVLVKGLQGPWSVGQDVQVGHWVGLGFLGFLGGVEPWSWVDHVILTIGCLEASPTEEECVGLAEVRVLWVHWHDEVFGKSLLAVLALEFLGTVVIGDLVVTLEILGEIGPGWDAQVSVLGDVEVRLEEVVKVLLGLGHRRGVDRSPVVEVLE